MMDSAPRTAGKISSGSTRRSSTWAGRLRARYRRHQPAARRIGGTHPKNIILFLATISALTIYLAFILREIKKDRDEFKRSTESYCLELNRKINLTNVRLGSLAGILNENTYSLLSAINGLAHRPTGGEPSDNSQTEIISNSKNYDNDGSPKRNIIIKNLS